MLNKPLRISEVPRIVMIGEGVIEKTSDVLTRLNLHSSGAIFVGSHVYSQFFDRLDTNLRKNGINCDVFQITSSSPKDLEPLINEVAQRSYKFIIAFGGGAVIDATKYVILQAKSSAELISLPTLASHDGIATPFIFLNDPTEKYMGMGRTAVAVMADIPIIDSYETNHRHLIASMGDILAKVSSTWDWRLAFRLKNVNFSDFSYTVARRNCTILLKRIESLPMVESSEERQEIVKAILINGFLSSFQKEIRVNFGSEHLFALKLDELAPGKALHGERCAMGTILMAALQGQNWLRVRRAMETVGLPVTAKQLGIRQSTIAKALLNCHEVIPDFYTILGEKGITEGAIWNLFYLTGIVGDLYTSD